MVFYLTISFAIPKHSLGSRHSTSIIQESIENLSSLTELSNLHGSPDPVNKILNRPVNLPRRRENTDKRGILR